MSLANKVKSLNSSLFDKTVERRRFIHQNPELSFKEVNTQRFVKQELENIGIQSIEEKADTGLVALIKGKKNSQKDDNKRIIALRADMDALPIEEQNECVYKSKNAGVMHACGHDVHTSSLLSTATILNQLSSEFFGTVKLIFQPGEEKLPGGASLMIKDGVLKNPSPHAIIGQHVMPLIDAGNVGFRKGMYMASADEIYIEVQGKGGHAAMPEQTIDPVLISAHIITALQQIISRWTAPKNPAVLSFGKIIGSGATNIIPSSVHIKGTFRALNEEYRMQMHERIKQLVHHTAKAMGGKADIIIKKGYPFLSNDEQLTEQLINSAKNYLGEEKVKMLDIWMASEDFAFYSQEIPASFYRLGTRNEQKNIIQSVHHPQFDIDEEAFKIAPGLMAWLTLEQLNN